MVDKSAYNRFNGTRDDDIREGRVRAVYEGEIADRQTPVRLQPALQRNQPDGDTPLLDDQQLVLLTSYETTEMERERQRLQIAINAK